MLTRSRSKPLADRLDLSRPRCTGRTPSHRPQQSPPAAVQRALWEPRSRVGCRWRLGVAPARLGAPPTDVAIARRAFHQFLPAGRLGGGRLASGSARPRDASEYRSVGHPAGAAAWRVPRCGGSAKSKQRRCVDLIVRSFGGLERSAKLCGQAAAWSARAFAQFVTVGSDVGPSSDQRRQASVQWRSVVCWMQSAPIPKRAANARISSSVNAACSDSANIFC